MKYKGVNKWYYGIALEEDYACWTHYRFRIYYFKLLERPHEGESFQKMHRKGFFKEFSFPWRLPRYIGIEK